MYDESDLSILAGALLMALAGKDAFRLCVEFIASACNQNLKRATNEWSTKPWII
jgi:hypothetical protein